MPPSRLIPLDRWLRRRRVLGVTGTLGAVVIVSVALLRPAGVFSEVDALDRRPVTLVEIIDGRTLRVRGEDGVEHTVRLLGLKVEDDKVNAARQTIEKAASGNPVTLAFDVDRLADADGTLLAYAYAHDGRLLNAWLIEQRLARADGSGHSIGDWLTRLDRRANKK